MSREALVHNLCNDLDNRIKSGDSAYNSGVDLIIKYEEQVTEPLEAKVRELEQALDGVKSVIDLKDQTIDVNAAYLKELQTANAVLTKKLEKAVAQRTYLLETVHSNVKVPRTFLDDMNRLDAELDQITKDSSVADSNQK